MLGGGVSACAQAVHVAASHAASVETIAGSPQLQQSRVTREVEGAAAGAAAAREFDACRASSSCRSRCSREVSCASPFEGRTVPGAADGGVAVAVLDGRGAWSGGRGAAAQLQFHSLSLARNPSESSAEMALIFDRAALSTVLRSPSVLHWANARCTHVLIAGGHPSTSPPLPPAASAGTAAGAAAGARHSDYGLRYVLGASVLWGMVPYLRSTLWACFCIPYPYSVLVTEFL